MAPIAREAAKVIILLQFGAAGSASGSRLCTRAYFCSPIAPAQICTRAYHREGQRDDTPPPLLGGRFMSTKGRSNRPFGVLGAVNFAKKDHGGYMPPPHK